MPTDEPSHRHHHDPDRESEAPLSRRRAVRLGMAAVATAAVVPLLSSTPAAAAPGPRPGPDDNRRKAARNTRVVRDFLQRVFNEHDADAVTSFMAPDVRWHGAVLGELTGVESLRGLFAGTFAGLPDLKATEQSLLAGGDLVSVQLVVTGTHTGPLLGVPATGRSVRWDAVDIYRLRDGLIVEEWAVDDIASLMRELGRFSPPWLT